MILVFCASLTNMDEVTVALLMEEEIEECVLLQEFMREYPHMIFRKRREERFLSNFSVFKVVSFSTW